MAEKLKGTYISACGMVHAEDIRQTQAAISEHLRLRTVYGVQVSPTTLLGGFNKRGSHWYPHGVPGLQRIVHSASQNVNARIALHLNPEDTIDTYVESFVMSALGSIAYASAASEQPLVSAVQLNNLDWLESNWSRLIRRLQDKGIAVILQANSKTCASNPDRFARALQVQAPDYVLLDSSGGHGTSFNADQYARLIEAVRNIGGPAIAIAGGLGPDESDLDNYRWLNDQFDDLSADAESKLRTYPAGRILSQSRYSVQKAAAYIQAVGTIQ